LRNSSNRITDIGKNAHTLLQLTKFVKLWLHAPLLMHFLKNIMLTSKTWMNKDKKKLIEEYSYLLPCGVSVVQLVEEKAD